MVTSPTFICDDIYYVSAHTMQAFSLLIFCVTLFFTRIFVGGGEGLGTRLLFLSAMTLKYIFFVPAVNRATSQKHIGKMIV